MICAYCVYAGKQNTLNNNSGSDEPDLTNLIRVAHSKCRGGTWCDCQHVIGQALNMTLLNAEAIKRSGTEAVAVGSA